MSMFIAVGRNDIVWRGSDVAEAHEVFNRYVREGKSVRMYSQGAVVMASTRYGRAKERKHGDARGRRNPPGTGHPWRVYVHYGKAPGPFLTKSRVMNLPVAATWDNQDKACAHAAKALRVAKSSVSCEPAHGDARKGGYRVGPPTEGQKRTVKLMHMRRRYLSGHDLEPWNDKIIDQARRALGLHGTRYHKGLATQATLANGLHVRLNPSKNQGVGRSGAARIQFLCPYCDKWWPAGRYGQHIVVHMPVGAMKRDPSRNSRGRFTR